MGLCPAVPLVVPVAGTHGGETDLDAKPLDFQSARGSGKGLPRHLFTSMASD